MEDDDPDLTVPRLWQDPDCWQWAREAGTTGRSWLLPFTNALYVIPTNRHASSVYNIVAAAHSNIVGVKNTALKWDKWPIAVLWRGHLMFAY